MIVFLTVLLFIVYECCRYWFAWPRYFESRPLFFAGAIGMWMVHVDKIIVHRKGARFVLLAGGMMLAWNIIQTWKYELPSSDVVVDRIAWYLYYVPITFIPLFLFITTLYFRKNVNHHLNWKWFLLFIPAFVLAILFLTNNLHQLAFRISDFSDNDHYTYGIVYYLELAWNILLFGATLILALIDSISASYRKYGFIPFSILIVGAALVLLRQLSVPVISYFTFSQYYWTMVILFFDALCSLKMIPTNVGYEDYFSRSSLDMAVCDRKLKPVYVAGSRQDYSTEDLKKALVSPCMIKENLLLTGKPIPGGFVFSNEDMTEINQAQKKLEEYNNILFEYKELLESENELAQREANIKVRSRIYDSIFVIIQPEYDYIERKLASIRPEDDSFVDDIRSLSVVDSYVKRISNLLLLKEGKETLPLMELTYSAKEMLGYLRFKGVIAAYKANNIPEELPSSEIILIYQLTWKIIFNSLDTLESISVFLNQEDNVRKLRIFVEGETKSYFGEGLLNQYSLKVEKEDSVTVYSIELGGMRHD